MTITITAFERSPDGGKGLARDTRVRWALEEVRQPYEVSTRLLQSDEGACASGASSVRPDPDLRGKRPRSVRDRRNRLPYRGVSMRACCRTMQVPGRARSAGCFAALNTVEPPILELADRENSGKRQAVDQRAPASGQGPRPRSTEATCGASWRCRLARWQLQRSRPDDGLGAATAESVGYSGRVSDPGGLCRPAARHGPPTSGLSPTNWRSTHPGKQ